jgi:hypothetical protein
LKLNEFKAWNGKVMSEPFTFGDIKLHCVNNEWFKAVEEFRPCSHFCDKNKMVYWLLDKDVKETIILEFTGFFDLNGPDPSRKLWEGDVLEIEHDDSKSYAVISWSDKGMWFGDMGFDSFAYSVYVLLREHKAKYAGNVFENSDLVPWYKEAQNGH